MAEQQKRTKKKRKGSLHRWIVIVALLLAAAAVWFFVLPRQGGTGGKTYKTYTASIGTISNSSSFTGSLELIDSAEYTASSASAVRQVNVSEGDRVTEGQRLLRLSSGQTVTADFDGTVNKLYVKKDDTVSAGDALIQIADFDHMKVSVRVDEYDISDVAVGQACTVTTTATEKAFESAIASIDYISSNSTGNVAYYTADAYVDTNGEAWPGMQVTLTIPKEEAKDVVVLKMDAISFDRKNQAYVLADDGSGNKAERQVEVGVSNGNYVEIKSGLAEGDTVYAESEETTQATGILSLFGGQMGRAPRSGMQQRGSWSGERTGGSGTGSGSGRSGGSGFGSGNGGGRP